MLWLGGLLGIAGATWGIFLAADRAIPHDEKDEQAESLQDVGDVPALNKLPRTYVRGFL